MKPVALEIVPQKLPRRRLLVPTLRRGRRERTVPANQMLDSQLLAPQKWTRSKAYPDCSQVGTQQNLAHATLLCVLEKGVRDNNVLEDVSHDSLLHE